MDDVLAVFRFSDPLWVWGVFPRLIGVVFLTSFVSLSAQSVALFGPRGAMPFERRLQMWRQSFSWWRRLAHFPTFFWLSTSRAMIHAHHVVGIGCALAVMYGGPLGHWGLLGCYVCYISLDKPVGLIFPWDCLLFELAFLGLMLPTWPALPALSAHAAPSPFVVWALRLVVFRVMFGFGKQKFSKSNRDDWVYLSGFLANQPLPSKVGWYMHKLPAWMLKLALLIMFVTEIPLPLLVFHPDLGVVAALGFIFLMIAIWLCGSFGYFSLVLMVACVPLLDWSTPRLLDVTALFGAGQPNLVHALVSVHLVGALISFPFNSWVAQHWHSLGVYWRAPLWLTWPMHFYSFIHPLRCVHPFGVFPPKTQPGCRVVPLIEASWNGQDWHLIPFPLSASGPKDAPRFISPHHARGDQALIYEAVGLVPQSYASGLIGTGDPVAFTSQCGAQALLQGYLGGAEIQGVFTKPDPSVAKKGPPTHARARTFLFRPTSLEEKRSTGAWWCVSYIGPHTPAASLEEGFLDDFLSPPELWHMEHIGWRRRSRVHALARACSAGRDFREVVTAHGVSVEDVDAFWGTFLPLLREADRTDWSALASVRKRLLQQLGRKGLRRHERVAGLLTVYATGRLDPHYLRRFRPALKAPSYAMLWMAIRDVMWDGEAAFDALMNEPLTLNERLEALTLEKGLYFDAVFRFDAMRFEAQKLRLLRRYVLDYQRKTDKERQKEMEAEPVIRAITCFADVVQFLEDKFVGPDFELDQPEQYPEFELGDDGVVRLKTELEWSCSTHPS